MSGPVTTFSVVKWREAPLTWSRLDYWMSWWRWKRSEQSRNYDTTRTDVLKANIHSFLESDDRVGVVMKFMDDALAELDNMDGLISTYKIHLNVSIASTTCVAPLTRMLGCRGWYPLHSISKSWFASSKSKSKSPASRASKSFGEYISPFQDASLMAMISANCSRR